MSREWPPTPSSRPHSIDLPHAPPIANDIRLVSPRESLPDKFRALFPYEFFNAVQSKCFAGAYECNDNLVVAAPTGSGKTAILELAICRLVARRGSQNFKIVYQAPTKALCSERSQDWEKKFRHMSLEVAQLTGDTSQSEMKRVSVASIIVTTPEKWDSVTRKWQDHHKLLELVELVLIDEVHTVNDLRGSTLEAVVSRMKTIGSSVRFIALSATIPNSEDVAMWLGRDHSNPHLPAQREAFGDELRPVKLQKFVYGYDSNGNDFIFDKFLDQKLPGVLAKHARGKPIMVFCFTRRSCESTARKLGECWASAASDDKLWPAPSQRIPVTTHALQEIVRWGVAFHHAGLTADDRAAVERHFLDGQLSVICCTGTLAVGVNLPCHTVVLKGTSGIQDNQPKEYSDLDVTQMLGRAGRPQFDNSAVAIILTKSQKRKKYENMILGTQILESTLHLTLIEHLNSEIVLGTINSVQSAKQWLAGTFLSIRLRRNPAHYNLTPSGSHTRQIDDELEDICERDIKKLQQSGLASEGVVESNKFRSTEYGRAMSSYMVRYETMKTILNIPSDAKMEQLIVILSQSSELAAIRLKPDERAGFRQLNKSPFILYPIKGTVATAWHKVSLLIQIALGGVELPSSDEQLGNLRRIIAMETKVVFECMQRLVRCFIDCRGADSNATGVKLGLELSRAMAAGSWEGRPTQLLQVQGIGPVGMRKLVAQDVRTVLQLTERNTMDIERILSRNPPYGKQISECVAKFPRLTLDLSIAGHDTHKPTARITATLGYRNESGRGYWKSKLPYVTFVAETTGGNLVHFWRGTVKKMSNNGSFDIKFSADLAEGEEVLCHLSCEEVVGTIVSRKLACGATQGAGGNARGEEHLEDEEPEFPDVDDLLEHDQIARPAQDIGGDEDWEPVQLSNGKWQCNHPCTGGGATKTGKQCSHKCCREGIDKPRRTKATKSASQKRKAESGTDGGAAAPSGSSRQQTQACQLSNNNWTAKRQKLASATPKTQQSLVAQTEAFPRSQQISSDNTEIECIDLCFSDDSDEFDFPPISTSRSLEKRTTQLDHQSQDASRPPDFLLRAPQQSEKQPPFELRKEVDSDDFGDDVFDDEDLVHLDDLLAPTCHRSARPFTSDFRDGTLFEGIGNGAPSASTGRQPSPRKPSHSTSKAIHEASKLLDLASSSFSLRDEVGEGENPDGLDNQTALCNPTCETEPGWLSEFDPEVVNMFRGFVNFA